MGETMKIAHDFLFDPTFGYGKDDLLTIHNPAPPEDFWPFWSGVHDRVQASPLEYAIEDELWSPQPGTRIFRVRFKNWDGVSIGMWVARPAHSLGGLLIGQGYGNPGQPVSTVDGGLTIALPCIRGLGLSQCRDIPWMCSEHCLHGIERKESYVITGGVADHWMAVRVLMDMFPDTSGQLTYSGGSLGGGMGAITVAFEPRFKAAEINVPNFGGQAVMDCRILPETSPGERRRQYVLQHPDCDTLRYVDASAAARFLRVPVLMTPALFDPSNPPPGQFAVANAIPEEFRILRIREVGHFKPTEQDCELEKELNEIGRGLKVRN